MALYNMKECFDEYSCMYVYTCTSTEVLKHIHYS